MTIWHTSLPTAKETIKAQKRHYKTAVHKSESQKHEREDVLKFMGTVKFPVNGIMGKWNKIHSHHKRRRKQRNVKYNLTNIRRFYVYKWDHDDEIFVSPNNKKITRRTQNRKKNSNITNETHINMNACKYKKYYMAIRTCICIYEHFYFLLDKFNHNNSHNNKYTHPLFFFTEIDHSVQFNGICVTCMYVYYTNTTK